MGNREQWLSEVITAGLDKGIFTPQDVLTHMTPEVMGDHLPRQLLAEVLRTALDQGEISPQSILRTVTPAVMSQHIPPDVVWECIAEAADRRRLGDEDGTPEPGDVERIRHFLLHVVEAGLRDNVLTAADLMRHIDAHILGTCLPRDLTTALLEAGLASGRMGPELVLEVVGVRGMAQYAPPHALWRCLAEVGRRAVKEADLRARTPTPPPAAGANLAAVPSALSYAGTLNHPHFGSFDDPPHLDELEDVDEVTELRQRKGGDTDDDKKGFFRRRKRE